MFALKILVIYVFCHEVEIVKSADELEFWDPHITHNARRTIEHRSTHHPNQDGGTIRFKKMKTKARSKDEAYKITKKVLKLKPMNALLRSGTQRSDRDDSTQDEVPLKWPKVHKRRYKTEDGEFRSTRVTPYYLMQQTEDKPADTTAAPIKHKHTGQDEDVELSPYNIQRQMKEIATEFVDANITVEVIGRTVEYNEIVLMKVTERKSDIGRYFRAGESKYVDEIPEKKIVLIVHGLSTMGIANIPCLVSEKQFKILLSFYFAHLDKFDIFLIPMANPDGFVKRHDLWNKNMSPQGACPGVSLDRNFDVAWNSSVGSSCSQHYPGPTPFSEKETRAIRDVLHHYSHKIIGYFNVHSASYIPQTFKGDAVLFPRGFTDAMFDDDRYIDLRGDVEEAMKNGSLQVLSVTLDTLYSWYGKVSGSSVDFACSVYGIPYAMELVMQSYLDIQEDNQEILYSMKALQDIWGRVIDTIFQNIWQHSKNGDS